jgi:outer membrane protein OmpA-like peptidoglycan-associated protein
MKDTILKTIEAIVTEGASKQVGHLWASDENLQLPQICIEGEQLTSFVFCDYLGLSQDERLIAGATYARLYRPEALRLACFYTRKESRLRKIYLCRDSFLSFVSPNLPLPMRLLAFILFVGFLFFAVFARWFFICDILGLCQEVPTAPVNERPRTLELTSNDTVVLSGYEQFAFTAGDYTPILTADNDLFLDTIATLMLADTTMRLQLTGKYTAEESEMLAGFYESMGMARAAAVRDLLEKRGIVAERFELEQELAAGTTVPEPLRFALLPPAGPSSYAKVVYTFTNMTYSDANFPSNGDVFQPGDAFKSYADSVKTYLQLRTEKTILIVGHTDSDDSEKYNYNLGLRRAKSARDYLQNMGITTQIEVVSKGETEPIVPNDSPLNKQKNRRVNFIIGMGKS